MTLAGGSSPVSAALCQALMELSDRGVLQIDDEHRIQGCNRVLCRILDYAPAELLAVGLGELRARDRSREKGPSLELLLRRGESHEGHYSFRRKDGTELHLACMLRVNAAPGMHLLLLSPPKMIGQSFMVEGESEQRLRMLIDQAPFAIQIFALDGTLLHANHGWEQIWGVSADDVVGRYNALRDPQIAAMGLSDIIARVFAGHEAGAVPAHEYSPAKTGQPGRKRWVELRFFHIRDEHQQIKYVCIQNAATVIGLNRYALMNRCVSRPTTAAGMNASTTFSAKERASFFSGSPLMVANTFSRYSQTTARIAPS